MQPVPSIDHGVIDHGARRQAAHKREANRRARIERIVRAMHDCCRGQTPQNYYVSRGYRVLQDLWCATTAPTAKNKAHLLESARMCIGHGCEPAERA